MSEGRILKTIPHQDGYLRVILKNKYGTPELKKVHFLVAEAFIPNPENKKNVKHKDGVLTNNRADNLEWVD